MQLFLTLLWYSARTGFQTHDCFITASIKMPVSSPDESIINTSTKSHTNRDSVVELERQPTARVYRSICLQVLLGRPTANCHRDIAAVKQTLAAVCGTGQHRCNVAAASRSCLLPHKSPWSALMRCDAAAAVTPYVYPAITV